jgi:hypothetical protein
MQATSRTFFDTYTAGGQRGAQEADADFWRQRLLGSLRFDAVACRAIVVPDTHLFDGRFFLEVDPDDLANGLSREVTQAEELPIEIRTRVRSCDLNDALGNLLRRPGHDFLNAFEFNSIVDRDVRAALAERLGTLPSSELDDALIRFDGRSPKAVAHVLRTALGKDDGSIDALERSWSRIISNTHRFDIRPWSGSFQIASALARDPLPETELGSELGVEILQRVEHQVRVDTVAGLSHTRGSARSIIRDGESRSLTPDEILDLETIQAWYTLGRHRAIALQHECNLGGTIPGGVRPTNAGRRVLLEPELILKSPIERIDLPEDFLGRLGALPGDEYRRACASVHSDLARWWGERDVRSLRKATQALAKAAELKGVEAGDTQDVLFSQVFTPAGGAIVVVSTALATGQAVPVAVSGAVLGAAAAAIQPIRRRLGTRRLVEYLEARSGSTHD